jgi:hypothetical protein
MECTQSTASAYTGCESRGHCPCSAGPVGLAVQVPSLRDLIRSRAASSIVRWPRVADGAVPGVRQQVLWLRKFRGALIPGAHAFPACFSRASTLSGPCDIPSGLLLQPPPPHGANRTRRPVFWLAFAWSSQFAHWTLEHLPRLWCTPPRTRPLPSRPPRRIRRRISSYHVVIGRYFLQLTRLLPRPPLVLVPRSLAPWQIDTIASLPTITIASQPHGPSQPHVRIPPEPEDPEDPARA